MSSEEFLDLSVGSGVLNSGDIGMSEISSIFNISMHPVVNELET